MTSVTPRWLEPFDLERVGLAEMLRCGRGIREASRDAATMEEAAGGIVRYLYEAARNAATGERSCALVRCFKTHAYGALDDELQAAARRSAGGAAPAAGTRCLTLLATIGDDPEWCDRRMSHGHQAIPLTSAEVVREAPMIAELVRSLGVPIEALVGQGADDEGMVRGAGGKTYNVFHVPEALGSPFIPAQAGFVVPHRIRSVLGFGAELPGNDILAVVMFTRSAIPPDSATRFRNVALDVKTAVFGYDASQVFAAR